jgi:hypothetical protein
MRERIEGLLVEAIAAGELMPTDTKCVWGMRHRTLTTRP